MGFIILFLFMSCCEGVHYPLTTDPIDVVIPCHAKDIPILDLCIAGIKANGEGVRNIYVISNERYTDQAEWVDEALFPFTKSEIATLAFRNSLLAEKYMKFDSNKAGWIYQQLLKFYSLFLIPDLSPNVLILDADTIFLNPVTFVTPEGNPLFNSATHVSSSYFKFMQKLVPGLHPFAELTAVTHHMIFQRAVVEDLFSTVESYHQMPFWQAFCTCTDFLKLVVPSEYDLYFHFIFSRSSQPELRKLKWKNITDLAQIPEYKSEGCHFVSVHSYKRKK